MELEAPIITSGKPDEKEEIIDFANFVFSMAHEPHNFAELLPKAYGAEADSTKWHYLIRDKGSLQAMVMSMPQKVDLEHVYPQVSFLRNGIGTVSVHHRARSKGYMRKLMHQAISDMVEAKVAYSFLGGQRQRYRYYGYEQAGTVVKFNLSLRNLVMTWPELKGLVVPADIKLLELPKSGPMLDEAYRLYLRQSALNARPKADFHLIGQTFAKKNMLIVRGEDEVLAFLSMSSELKAVDDIFYAEELVAPDTLLYYLLTLVDSDNINFELKAADGGAALHLEKKLYEAAEYTSIGSGCMLLILDFSRTIAMHLADKATRTRLAAGELHLKVTDCPGPQGSQQSVRIQVSEDRLIVSNQDETVLDVAFPQLAETAETKTSEAVSVELEMSYFDCLVTLFSYRGRIEGSLAKLLPPALASWFPLNCHIVAADNC